jgi:putative colanic acid biosynthesis acetyltransferase WcaF
MSPQLDISLNRRVRKYSNAEMGWRIAWLFGHWLLRLSPRPCFAWRRVVLRCFGAKVGAQVHVYPSTRILFPWNLRVGNWTALGEDVLIYNPGLVTIGEKVTVSHGAHLCAGTHDHSQSDMPVLKLPIEVGDQVWLCAEAFVGPGVRVGVGSIVGARAVVMKSVAPWTVVAGNPARVIGPRELTDSNFTRDHLESAVR